MPPTATKTTGTLRHSSLVRLVAFACVIATASGCGTALGQSPSQATTTPGPSPTSGPSPTPTPFVPPLPGPSNPSSLGLATLHHTLLATDIDPATGALIGGGETFPAGTQQILALLAWDSAPFGTQLGVRVLHEGILVHEQTHDVERTSGEFIEGEFARRSVGYVMPIAPEDGFADGTYQLDVSFNGLPDESLYFTVGGSADPATLVGEGDDTGPIPYKDPSTVLVVTREAVLRENMGAATDDVLAAAELVGEVHDLDEGGVVRDTAEVAGEFVRELLTEGEFQYLLIVGNHDAVPFYEMANPYGEEEEGELVGTQLPFEWLPSDDPYGDIEPDAFETPDIAVARIPSSDDPELLLTQLGTNTPPDGHGYALINQKRRSQGGTVVAAMNTASAVELNFAPPTMSEEFAAGNASNARYIYVLLHGIGVLTDAWAADIEAWFPADTEEAEPFESEWSVKLVDQTAAVSLEHPPASSGLVSVGACYGAWTLDTTHPAGPPHKTAENNLAMHYLKSGARAFVADTHLSYSVRQDLDSLPVGRTGFEKVYWKGIGEGLAPIDAFQAAKEEMSQAILVLALSGNPVAARITQKTLHYMVYLGRP